MNIFSNVGITELILILLLALIVVGPERLPELAQRLGKTLRDIRKMYENLASDLGPELMSLQQSTQDLRDSVESVRSIPKDMVQQVVEAAELDETIGNLKDVTDSVEQVGQTLSEAKKVVRDPVTAAVDSVKASLAPSESVEGEGVEDPGSNAQAPKEEPATLSREEVEAEKAEKPEEPGAEREAQAKNDEFTEEPGSQEQTTEAEAETEAMLGSGPQGQMKDKESATEQQAPVGEAGSSAQTSTESQAAEQDNE